MLPLHEMTTELRGDDPGRWGHSLANLSELLTPLLDAARAKTVVEIGAYAGDLTRELLQWADGADARIVAIDPAPQPELLELSDARANLDLIREPSHTALEDLDTPDAVIVDGDHNYYTVSEELQLIAGRLSSRDGPLVILHDVCWPHARRDAYYSPERIPETHRQPIVEGGGLVPGEPGVVPGGLPYKWVAAREGGPRNGVLTAVEDFASGQGGIRVAIVPAFFGLGVIWRLDAPWAAAVAEIIDPWDRNPIVERLEANRVHHLAREHTQRPELDRLKARNKQKAELLEGLLKSRAFKLAEYLSRLRNPRRPSVWRDDAKRLIDDG